MRLGADADALERTAVALAEGGDALERLVADLSTAATAARWHGPDADRFRGHWHDSGASAARRVAASLRGAGTALRTQASAQRTTSTADASRLAPMPSRIRIVEIDASAGMELLGSARLRFRVEDLGNGRSRIVEEGSLGVGVGIDTVTSAYLHGGGSVSWLIDSDDLDEFLVAQAGTVVLGPLAWLFDDPLDLADVERIGVDQGTSGSTSAGIHLGDVDVAIEGDVEARGAVSRNLVDGTWAVDLRLESSWGDAVGRVTLGGDGSPRDLTVTTTTSADAGGVTVTRTSLDLTDPALRREVSQLVDALGPGGDVVGAVEELLRAGTGAMEIRTDVFDADAGTYGIETPIGSLVVTTEELRRR